ncbi:MAG: c-type cytochrome [Arachidicoccus sp.]|nr:c-type cytochrome [Arachidicoccus sp.]
MKTLSVIATIFVTGIVLVSCDHVRRSPGHLYMPDMFISRAYETYDQRDSAQFTTDISKAGEKIFYNNMPVAGTIARDEDLPFPLSQDKPGDTTNYIASKLIENPEAPLTAAEATEMHRLYLINCGICHGAKMDGNGPLYNGGNGPFSSAPKNLLGDPIVSVMPEGQMFYSIQYGKNMMGSYASQLSRKQRWQLVHYIKAIQNKTKKLPVSPADVADSTVLDNIKL